MDRDEWMHVRMDGGRLKCIEVLKCTNSNFRISIKVTEVCQSRIFFKPHLEREEKPLAQVDICSSFKICILTFSELKI